MACSQWVQPGCKILRSGKPEKYFDFVIKCVAGTSSIMLFCLMSYLIQLQLFESLINSTHTSGISHLKYGLCLCNYLAGCAFTVLARSQQSVDEEVNLCSAEVIALVVPLSSTD